MEYEVEEKWTGGGNKRCDRVRWAHAPAQSTHVGGISIGLHPIIGRYAQKKPVIDKWSRWVSQEIQGKKSIVTIIGTYGPTGSSTVGGSMWAIQTRKILEEWTSLSKTQQGKTRRLNPRQQYIKDLTAYVKAEKDRGHQIIMMGDMNIKWRGESPEERSWVQNMHEQDMVNALEKTIPEQVYTFKPRQTWIDHALLSHSLIKKGVLKDACVEVGGGFYSSDHCMTIIQIDATKLLNGISRMTEGYQERIRTLQCTDKQHVILYGKAIEKTAKKWQTQGKGDVVTQMKRLFEKGKLDNKRGMYKYTRNKRVREKKKNKRRKMERKMGVMMGKIVQLMLEAEDLMATQLNNKMANGGLNHWSRWMLKKNSDVRQIKGMLRDSCTNQE